MPCSLYTLMSKLHNLKLKSAKKLISTNVVIKLEFIVRDTFSSRVKHHSRKAIYLTSVVSVKRLSVKTFNLKNDDFSIVIYPINVLEARKPQ